MIAQDPVMLELVMVEDDLDSQRVTADCEQLFPFRLVAPDTSFAPKWAKSMASSFRLEETRLRQTILYHPAQWCVHNKGA